MLLLPDQTYEQYQGEKTLTTSPLIALKRILGDANFCPKIPHFDVGLPNGVPKGKTSTTRNGQNGNFNGFFGIHLGNSSGSSNKTGEQRTKNVQQPQRTDTPESFKATCDFFNNIPEFHGEPLGPFSIPKAHKMSDADADLLKECELLLNKYRIRPDFFCRYRKAMDESAKMDSKPTSWPRSQIESHITKTSREKRKLQSSSPSSRNHPASVRHMKRFQKSTAIYTLPIRGKQQQHTGTHCKTEYAS
ncbi:uncharacterized protein LOC129569673 [Sitodiplosis mosellana]|uniref:uncharacterized protein LOC129569673 n=1 Tax=Sitodiplosis mosellana TaxID=263140 RepID=UPI002443E346|nr:uncharacterized protein LOC129569673 [Sitodiplosis mosellana]